MGLVMQILRLSEMVYRLSDTLHQIAEMSNESYLTLNAPITFHTFSKQDMGLIMQM